MDDPKIPKSHRFDRDDDYWRALLDHVDSLSEEELQAATAADAPADDLDSAGRVSAEYELWKVAAAGLEEDQTFEVPVTGFNKGGLLVSWNGLSGFVPASQLSNLPKFHIASERVNELRRRVGERIKAKIIEVNPVSNRLIFSERAVSVDADTRDQLWQRLKIGSTRHGVITNMTDFGAFVDLGGIEGLIHISELSWSRLNHPSDVVRPGQIVEVKIVQVDRASERIALSLKRMREDPWKNVSERYQPDQLVHGVVSSVMPYGAFVTVEDQLEGLIHISELADGNLLHPRYVVRKGQEITAKVLSVDGKARRLALTLRGVDEGNA